VVIELEIIGTWSLTQKRVKELLNRVGDNVICDECQKERNA
jgi:hypothetical protein